MKRSVYTLILTIVYLLPGTSALAQTEKSAGSPVQFGIGHLMEFLNLKPTDLTFRPDYTEPDSFRLQVVAELMQQPMKMLEYVDNLQQAHAKGQPDVLAGILFQDLARNAQAARMQPYRPTNKQLEMRLPLYYTHVKTNTLLTKSYTFLEVVLPRCTEAALQNLTKSQTSFLTRELKEIVVIDENEEFLDVAQLDSLEKLEESFAERFTAFGYQINVDPIILASTDYLQEILPELRSIQAEIDRGALSVESLVKKGAMLPEQSGAESYLGKQSGWAVGGSGNDTYEGEYSFILDFGGDDTYRLSYSPDRPHGCVIIDLSGNDFYRAQTDFAIGSGCLSSGMLLDFAGDDRYEGKSFSMGSAFLGFGLVYDQFGSDRYDGDTHVQGAGTFGIGLLIDEGGRDVYNAAVYAQAFGFVRGIGVLYDVDGSDSYYAGGKYKDILRFSDRYISMSQGFGYGLRPLMSGGIGALIDLKGSDTYSSDIFGQASSYWWSLGMILDDEGNDQYICHQYGQGSAAHMTLGALFDNAGNDVYNGKGLMQGVGHDYSCGVLLDREGDDTYGAFDLSQGAGSANGFGVLIDIRGDDRYFVKDTVNTQGYGNPRRDYGSIGLFIDLNGTDQYFGHGKNNYYWKTASQWGGGMDIQYQSADSSRLSQE